ncbi:MAG: DUF4783 domain-containing protein [Bacteroidales bacterium]|nr:DUF4783 domain-containing protein [Bacteroidales bacterium]
MAKLLIKFTLSALLLLLAADLRAQNIESEVLEPFAKCMAEGDADGLARYFAEQMETAILDDERYSSRNQALARMKDFFKTYSPKSFRISHISGRQDMKYAVGELNAGGSDFKVTVFVGGKEKHKKIQNLKIENSR